MNGFMHGTGYGMLDSVGGFFLNLLIILLIVGVVVVLLNRSGYTNAAPMENERIVRMEKDIEEIKKTVEEIKSKLEEI